MMTFDISPKVSISEMDIQHVLSYRDNTITQVRMQFADELMREHYIEDKSGVKMLEIQGGNFVADEPAIFGSVNDEYAKKEIDWYVSMSLNVNDIPGEVPTGWKQVADKDGFINSNYGWCIFSNENKCQYENVLQELIDKPTSRRATMIYTRPSMWYDYKENGRSDFMCTNVVQYLMRDGYLDVVVQMRSNDVYWGYRNDRHWQKYVQDKLVSDLRAAGYPDIEPGTIYWQVGSLHIYEKDFFLVSHYIKSGNTSITKKKYRELYPDSPWAN